MRRCFLAFFAFLAPLACNSPKPQVSANAAGLSDATTAALDTTIQATMDSRAAVTVVAPPSSAPASAQVPPCSPTVFCPGDSLQLKVDALGPVTFIFTPGTYRGQSIRPKSGQSFVGMPGAVMNGAKVVTGWTQTGAAWSASVSVPALNPPVQPNACDAQHPACWSAEDAFLDGVRLLRVATPAHVIPGSYSYASGVLTVGDDPAGHLIELTATSYAFRGTGETGSPGNVTITHLAIEHYAGSDAGGYRGAVWLESASKGWRVDSNDIGANHWGSVGLGSHTTVRGNHLHGNGLHGFSAYNTDSSVIAENEIDSNSVAGYSCAWDCGAGKITKSRWLVVANNRIHHNGGKGVWLDGDNIWCNVYGNVITANREHGIFHEIGEDCAIHDNMISNGGTTHLVSGSGGGIVVANSQNVEIYGNTVTGYGNGIVVRYDGPRGTSGRPGMGAWTLKHVHVHDNAVAMSVAGSFLGGYDQSDRGVTWADSTDVTFRHNTYTLSGPAPYFKWCCGRGTLVSDAAWKAATHDTLSTYIRR